MLLVCISASLHLIFIFHLILYYIICFSVTNKKNNKKNADKQIRNGIGFYKISCFSMSTSDVYTLWKTRITVQVTRILLWQYQSDANNFTDNK